MSGVPLDAKERVRQAVDIVDLVGSYLQLRRQGRGYVALCPWHDDTRPSLQVNPERQSFKCWVCDIGGDIFSFVMKMEGVEFPEALAMLAERAGVNCDSLATKRRSRRPTTIDKRTLYQAMAWADEQYHRLLLDVAEAEAARRYLPSAASRAESIERFHLGFSPDRVGLARAGGPAARLTRRPVLETIGLLARRRRRATTTVSRPAAVLDPRRPGPAGGHGRPRAARRRGRDRAAGQVRQLARDAAVHQEQLALRPRPGPRRDPQDTHARW